MMPVSKRNILEKKDTYSQTNTAVSCRRNGEKNEGYVLQKQIRRGQVQSFDTVSANLDSPRCRKTKGQNVNCKVWEFRQRILTILAEIKGL